MSGLNLRGGLDLTKGIPAPEPEESKTAPSPQKTTTTTTTTVKSTKKSTSKK